MSMSASVVDVAIVVNGRAMVDFLHGDCALLTVHLPRTLLLYFTVVGTKVLILCFVLINCSVLPPLICPRSDEMAGLVLFSSPRHVSSALKFTFYMEMSCPSMDLANLRSADLHCTSCTGCLRGTCCAAACKGVPRHVLNAVSH